MPYGGELTASPTLCLVAVSIPCQYVILYPVFDNEDNKGGDAQEKACKKQLEQQDGLSLSPKAMGNYRKHQYGNDVSKSYDQQSVCPVRRSAGKGKNAEVGNSWRKENIGAD